MNDLTPLQRVRFCAISPAGYDNETFFRSNFNQGAWEKSGRSVYWSEAGSSAAVAHDPLGATIPAGATLDGDGYFNAFFLAYWRKLTAVRALGLRMRFAGQARVRLQAQSVLGDVVTLHDATVEHAAEQDWQIVLPAEAIPADAIRLSFQLIAISAAVRLTGGAWVTPEASRRQPKVAIVMPTYGRAHFARKTVATLLADPEAAALFDRIVLIEQSDQAELADLAGPKCAYVRQPNLGGAGGFARGMYECVFAQTMGEPTHLLFMDDDVMIETDAILRAIRLAAYATEDRVIGGGMLDLFRPQSAVALGESNEIGEFGYYTLKQVYPRADMASSVTLNLASLPQPVGYCAWWFCLFPAEAVREVGLPIPCFFRGDDLQWGTRARLAGYTPYLVPGIGVWHLPFQSKSLPWVTYFDRYNTLVGNALHGAAEVERYFIYSLHETKSLFGHKQFAYAAAAVMAIEDYLRGWTHFRDRAFPEALQRVKHALAPFAKSEVTPATLNQLRMQVEALEKRFATLSPIYTKLGAKVRAEFAREMPAVYTRAAWQDYFTTGSLRGLPSPAAKPTPEHALAS